MHMHTHTYSNGNEEVIFVKQSSWDVQLLIQALKIPLVIYVCFHSSLSFLILISQLLGRGTGDGGR